MNRAHNQRDVKSHLMLLPTPSRESWIDQLNESYNYFCSTSRDIVITDTSFDFFFCMLHAHACPKVALPGDLLIPNGPQRHRDAQNRSRTHALTDALAAPLTQRQHRAGVALLLIGAPSPLHHHRSSSSVPAARRLPQHPSLLLPPLAADAAAAAAAAAPRPGIASSTSSVPCRAVPRRGERSPPADPKCSASVRTFGSLAL